MAGRVGSRGARPDPTRRDATHTPTLGRVGSRATRPEATHTATSNCMQHWLALGSLSGRSRVGSTCIPTSTAVFDGGRVGSRNATITALQQPILFIKLEGGSGRARDPTRPDLHSNKRCYIAFLGRSSGQVGSGRDNQSQQDTRDRSKRRRATDLRKRHGRARYCNHSGWGHTAQVQCFQIKKTALTHATLSVKQINSCAGRAFAPKALRRELAEGCRERLQGCARDGARGAAH